MSDDTLNIGQLITDQSRSESRSASILISLTEKEKEMLQKNIKSNSTSSERGCWNWKKGKNKRGYGYTYVRSIAIGAHRVSFVVFNSEMCTGLLVCHKCDNPSCVNPEHLFVGTNKDNVDDMISKGRKYKNPIRTHCKNGHVFSPENTWVYGSKRICKACIYINNKRWRISNPEKLKAQKTRRRLRKCTLPQPNLPHQQIHPATSSCARMVPSTPPDHHTGWPFL